MAEFCPWRRHPAEPIRPVTDNAGVRQRPITDALAWHRALESIAVTNLRIAFTWPRLWLTWWER